jgi:hypothetical protein
MKTLSQNYLPVRTCIAEHCVKSQIKVKWTMCGMLFIFVFSSLSFFLALFFSQCIENWQNALVIDGGYKS